MIIDKDKLSKWQRKYHIGDIVAFNLKGQKFLGQIKKGYYHSFLIAFHSDDPEIVDKYHNKTVINNRKLHLIKRPSKKD